MIIIKNARLIGPLTEGYDGQYADIWVDNGRITEIRPQGWTPSGSGLYPEGVQVIDAAGNTVMPGLIDMHAHVYMKSLDFNKVKGLDAAHSVLNAYMYAGEYLKAGYTTVRD